MIELIVCVVIIGLLAFLTLPVVGKRRPDPKWEKVSQARKEIGYLLRAIQEYQQVYTNALPVTDEILLAGHPDFTFGTYGIKDLPPGYKVENSGDRLQANNAQIMAILSAKDSPAYNPGHRYNPEKRNFLESNRVTETDGLGLDPVTLVYRDPWGLPYIISFDLNGDGWTQDAFYSLNRVSFHKLNQPEGRFNLFTVSGQFTNDFGIKSRVMIWSLSMDRAADPKVKANEGVNGDNVLSWK